MLPHKKIRMRANQPIRLYEGHGSRIVLSEGKVVEIVIPFRNAEYGLMTINHPDFPEQAELVKLKYFTPIKVKNNACNKNTSFTRVRGGTKYG